MDNLYDRNGLLFWSEEEVRLRRMFEERLVGVVAGTLKELNSAFEVIQVEAPLLTPVNLINKNYTSSDVWCFNEEALTLRPETTMGSYAYARHLLNSHNARKVRLPLCVWQHGKSFRREQDQVTKNMRLKEFYQLEFQCIYGLTTANDYSTVVVPRVAQALGALLGSVRVEPSDRLPDYSESTQDVVLESNSMEVCSISKRRDFEGAKVLEIAIGTDRCVYNFLNRAG